MNQNNTKISKDYEYYINYGLKNINNLNNKTAIDSFKKAIRLDKQNFKAYINLANLYILNNNIEESTELLIKYTKSYGFEKNIIHHLSKICIKYNLLNDLENLFDILKIKNLKKNKNNSFIFFIEGKYYEKKSLMDLAVISYSNSISCDKLFFDSYDRILNILETINNLRLLEKYLDLGFKNLFEEHHINILTLFRCILLNRKKRYKESQSIMNEKFLNNKFLNDKFYLPKILDLESKNYEKLNDYTLAFQKVKLRNNILNNLDINKKFNHDVIFNTIYKYKHFYNKKNVESINNRLHYNDDSNLVFLVGFPRSGTTLLDTILRTHSKINVLEEQPFLLNLRHKFFIKNNNKLESLKKITQYEKDQIRESYFKDINYHKNKITIDKLPLSIIELGFIKCIFPNSRIILAQRHPCDVVISCFFTWFKINDAMINFLDWNKTLKFYNSVFDLFEFYESQLNLNIFNIKYENVVYDFENQINLLLNHLGLNYEDNLQKFHITAKQRRKISTPSYTQVINPLYTTSINKWKNYNNIIDPMPNLEKWVRKFNY